MTLAALLKVLHVAALSVWIGGLLVLPALYRARMRFASGPALHDWQRFTRAVLIQFMSPAAFLTIGTGAALIFVNEVFTPWMALKLLSVGALAGLHVWAAHVVLVLFEDGRTYPIWRQLSATVTAAAAAGVTLVLVLAKPAFDLDRLPRWLLEPGGLQSLAPIIVPTP